MLDIMPTTMVQAKRYRYYVNAQLVAKGKCLTATGLPRRLGPPPIEGNTLRVSESATAPAQWLWFNDGRWIKMCKLNITTPQCHTLA